MLFSLTRATTEFRVLRRETIAHVALTLWPRHRAASRFLRALAQSAQNVALTRPRRVSVQNAGAVTDIIVVQDDEVVLIE